MLDEVVVKRLGSIYAVNAEIEGMRADNAVRAMDNEAPAYRANDFLAKAEELRSLVAAHPDQMGR